MRSCRGRPDERELRHLRYVLRSAAVCRAAGKRPVGYAGAPMKVSLQLIPEQPIEELLRAAQLADELGYYACYGADEIYHKDAWLVLAAAAGRTERIRLGPCVSPIYMRDPTYVAQL